MTHEEAQLQKERVDSYKHYNAKIEDLKRRLASLQGRTGNRKDTLAISTNGYSATLPEEMRKDVENMVEKAITVYENKIKEL